MKQTRRQQSGFTIVELAVVILVIVILALISIVAYGSWRERTLTSAVLSDLRAVSSTMESSRQFSTSGYPTSVPSTFEASDSVTVSYEFGDSAYYCIEASATEDTSILYHIDPTTKDDPKEGACYIAATSISGDYNGECALAMNKRAYCWGRDGAGSNGVANGAGKLGDGNFMNSATPVAVDMTGVLSGKTLKFVDTGAYHSCAIASDDRAYCWGNNQYGQLGDGTNDNSGVPVAVQMTGALAGKTIKQIVASTWHTCALASDNYAYCWGYGQYGKLGDGTTSSRNTPTAVNRTGVLAGKTIKNLGRVKNDRNSCAIASDDKLYCWGNNGYGQFGNGGTSASNNPVAAGSTGALAGKDIKEMVSAQQRGCAITTENLVYCFGQFATYTLGDGSSTNSSNPVAVSTSGDLSGKSIRDVAVGNYAICVLSFDEEAFCWGLNTGTSLLFANSTSSSSTVPVRSATQGDLSGKKIKHIVVVGDNTVCAIEENGKPYCWGYSQYGQVGDGLTSTRVAPTAVLPFTM